MATFTRPPRLSELAGCGSLSAAQDAGFHYQTHLSPLEPNISRAAHDRGELSPPRRPPGPSGAMARRSIRRTPEFPTPCALKKEFFG